MFTKKKVAHLSLVAALLGSTFAWHVPAYATATCGGRYYFCESDAIEAAK